MAYPSKVISVSLPPDLHGIGKALARHRKDSLVKIIVNEPQFRQLLIHQLVQAVSIKGG